MSIGSTSGKEPDHIEDGDLKSPEELRGAMKDILKAKMSLVEKATVEGVMTEIQVLKQQLEMTHEQMRSLIHIYGTLRDQFDQFQAQRIKELNVRVNGGSTTPEDLE
jgi:hypothetical protein